ncbi:hypothetical protein [Microvirga sp. BSC39]|uniref:hypothetical protein n=1 Tax=Microvirga sp. BSC39 TaxID=1549810 RepID=UPI0004E8EBCD|nr:hypothetical protein [Microvirga sp. BSC39]KFG68136.1 hypothetical protein JH26_18065 [Microvirga sp. BSC39]
MARKRKQETADILQDAIRRVAPSQRDVDTEALRRYLGLPEHDGFVDDGRVTSALAEMRSLEEWAAKGAEELAKAVPSLRWSEGEDGVVSWSVRVCLPLLDDGRMELRLMLPPTPQMLEILHLPSPPITSKPSIPTVLLAMHSPCRSSRLWSCPRPFWVCSRIPSVSTVRSGR